MLRHGFLLVSACYMACWGDWGGQPTPKSLLNVHLIDYDLIGPHSRSFRHTASHVLLSRSKIELLHSANPQAQIERGQDVQIEQSRRNQPAQNHYCDRAHDLK